MLIENAVIGDSFNQQQAQRKRKRDDIDGREGCDDH
jgi:hypothetical protein